MPSACDGGETRSPLPSGPVQMALAREVFFPVNDVGSTSRVSEVCLSSFSFFFILSTPILVFMAGFCFFLRPGGCFFCQPSLLPFVPFFLPLPAASIFTADPTQNPCTLCLRPSNICVSFSPVFPVVIAVFLHPAVSAH